MNIWWSDEQDKVWARSTWSKRVDDESKNIHWVLEVTTEENRLQMGFISIHGTIIGDLTLALSEPIK